MNSLELVSDGIFSTEAELKSLAEKKEAKILALSDSHGREDEIRFVIENYAEKCDALMFAGDGAQDIINILEEAENDEKLKQKLPATICFVKGNNDPFKCISRFSFSSDGKNDSAYEERTKDSKADIKNGCAGKNNSEGTNDSNDSDEIKNHGNQRNSSDGTQNLGNQNPAENPAENPAYQKNQFYQISVPKEIKICAAGKKILMVHGNEHAASYTTSCLVQRAEETESDIVVFGHTHFPQENPFSKYLMNPGSIAFPRRLSKPGFAYLFVQGKNIVYSTFMRREKLSEMKFTPFVPDQMF